MYVRHTSIAAWNEINQTGLLSKRRLQVYNYLYANGPCTSKQVTMAFRRSDNIDSGFHNRLGELRDLGVVRELGTIDDPDGSGRKMILWDVTERVPVKSMRPRKMTLKQAMLEIAALQRRIAELEGLLCDKKQKELFP